mgnify:CR=1 FL=1
MTRDDSRDGERDPGPDDEALAAAETRVIAEDAPPLPSSGQGAAEIAAAETRVIEDAGEVAETRVLPPTAVTDLEPGGAREEDDRTQVIARSKPLPSDPAGIDTRVLDPTDKTEPPPVNAAAPAAGPIDPERGLSPGTVLFGEYEIVNVLGVGGMGEVYRARHRRLDEHRASKVRHAELSKKKGASEFFYREAKALLAVRHPAVVHCHDLLSDDAGRVYLIMEMIEGIPLSKKMNDGPLSPDDVAILGARVAHGLAAAHRKGVIHRDVSPDNIVLPNGRVQEAKIIDFGIAKRLEEGEGTILDGFKGKLSYASPEQLGFFGGKLDGRSDFYSLGLVLAAAALGRPMGMGTTVMEAVDARRSFQTLPDAIPVGLRSAIQPLLALDPDDRPRYVDRLFVVPGGQDDFTDPSLSGSAGASPAVGERSRVGSRAGLLVAVAVAAIALVAGGLYLGPGRSGEVTPATAAVPSSPPAAEAIQATPETTPRDEARTPPPPAQERPTAASEAVAKAPAALVVPSPRRLSAQERIQIIGLLNNAKLALDENRLMSPAGDNAYDRYRRVLGLDPDNARAKQGLTAVAARYVGLADRAIDEGDAEQARTFVERARQADARHPGIAGIERRLNR